MSDLWSVLLPILLTDVVNPVLFAFMVYAVGTERPLTNSASVLVGHTASYLVFGVALAFAFETIAERLANPRSIDFAFGLLVGLLLLWVAWLSSRGSRRKTSEPSAERLTPFKAFGTGAVINVVGLPFALPYFAALDQILKANLSVTDSVIALTGYNLAYAAPFLIVPALSVLLGEKSRPLLARINEKVDRIGAFLMPLMLFLVGIAMVADAILYFALGEGLF